ncbi:MAG: flagellar biosynthesis anti-sigma factor FlgM [Rhodanobacteraceae bacterium]
MTSKINSLPPIATTPELAPVGARRAGPTAKDAMASGTDSLQLTPSARTLGDADAPVDSHRVEKLRQAIADGSYRVDADRIAGKLLETERTSRKD